MHAIATAAHRLQACMLPGLAYLYVGRKLETSTLACIPACLANRCAWHLRMQVAWLGEGGSGGEPSRVRYAGEDMAQLRVLDRGIMVGDVVAAASAPLGQVSGRVTSVWPTRACTRLCSLPQESA